jgi:hypothetical protein
VADEHAGCITRCPGCQTTLKVPDPEPAPEFEVVEEPERPRARPIKAEKEEKKPYTFKRERDEDDDDDRPRRKKKRRRVRTTQRNTGSKFNFGMAWRIFAGLFFVLIGIGGLILNIGENNWRNVVRASFMILIGGSILLYGFSHRE